MYCSAMWNPITDSRTTQSENYCSASRRIFQTAEQRILKKMKRFQWLDQSYNLRRINPEIEAKKNQKKPREDFEPATLISPKHFHRFIFSEDEWPGEYL